MVVTRQQLREGICCVGWGVGSVIGDLCLLRRVVSFFLLVSQYRMKEA
jgi:hypothetical protein